MSVIRQPHANKRRRYIDARLLAPPCLAFKISADLDGFMEIQVPVQASVSLRVDHLDPEDRCAGLTSEPDDVHVFSRFFDCGTIGLREPRALIDINALASGDPL